MALPIQPQVASTFYSFKNTTKNRAVTKISGTPLDLASDQKNWVTNREGLPNITAVSNP